MLWNIQHAKVAFTVAVISIVTSPWIMHMQCKMDAALPRELGYQVRSKSLTKCVNKLILYCVVHNIKICLTCMLLGADSYLGTHTQHRLGRRLSGRRHGCGIVSRRVASISMSLQNVGSGKWLQVIPHWCHKCFMYTVKKHSIIMCIYLIYEWMGAMICCSSLWICTITENITSKVNVCSS